MSAARALYPFLPIRIPVPPHSFVTTEKQELINIHIWLKSGLRNKFTLPEAVWVVGECFVHLRRCETIY